MCFGSFLAYSIRKWGKKFSKWRLFWGKRGLKLVPGEMVSFQYHMMNPLVSHAAKLPCSKQIQWIERIFPISGSHADRRKSKSSWEKKRKLSFYCLVYIARTLYFMLLIEIKWETNPPCDCSLTHKKKKDHKEGSKGIALIPRFPLMGPSQSLALTTSFPFVAPFICEPTKSKRKRYLHFFRWICHSFGILKSWNDIYRGSGCFLFLPYTLP